MRTTGNTITINTFIGGHFEDAPVMVNGKATKRTKRVYVEEYGDVELTGIEVEGHEVFVEKSNYDENGYYCYRADGTRLTCMCRFGRYGQADHKEIVMYNSKHDALYTPSRGYEGATWKGFGATIKRINW